MSMDAEAKGYKGVANWFFVQWKEEQDHAQILMNYLNSRDAKVVLKPIAEVRTEWESVQEMFRETLRHEKVVTSLINNLATIAHDDRDFASSNMLVWFIDEQIEEEENARDMIFASEAAEGDKYGMYQLDKELDAFNKKTGYEVAIHVDAASGGFILPFLKPEFKWDFRLKWVYSISTSGHKYGLVYPGLGWVVWRDKKCLPEEMAFSVNYLGANITQVGLNFSRPAAQILGQYYNFIRYGFEGYKEIQSASMEIAEYCHEKIGKMKCFTNYSKSVDNPLFIWYMNPDYDKTAKWTLYDLQAALQQSGWMVPAYTMPKNIEDMVVMRIVVRQGMSRDMADMLIEDIRNAVAELDKLEYPTPTRIAAQKSEKQKGKVYTH